MYPDTKELFIDTEDICRSEYFSVIFAGTGSALPERRFFSPTADTYVFGYITEGSASIKSADAKYDAPKGSFYFIEKGTPFILSPNASAPFEQMWMELDGNLTENLVRTFQLTSIRIEERNVSRFFTEILSRLSGIKKENSAVTLQHVSCLLFEMLTEIQYESFFASAGHTASLAEKIRSAIDSNIYNEISLDMLTEQFGISKMHIIRLFKKEFGITPMQYLIDRRIGLAKSLLSGTVMPIKEISDLLRYSNTQHFSNTFRNSVGISPNQYRKTEQSKI